LAGKTLLIPDPLKERDNIAVFSPAGVVQREELNLGLHELRSWGFAYHLSSFALSRCRYLAGRDEERVLDLMRTMTEFPALWASRGGYGCLRLLPWLEELLPKRRHFKPFWLLGFSDLTILLNYFYQRYGLVTLHAPLVSSLPHIDPEARHTVRRLLLGQQRFVVYQGVFWREGSASGPLLGGNLASLVSLLGTPWFPNLDGALLLLEEVNESPYRVDRLLTQLSLSGELSKANALILGEFKGLGEDVLFELVTAVFSGPILARLPVGHGTQNFPLFIGLPAQIYPHGNKGLLEQTLT